MVFWSSKRRYLCFSRAAWWPNYASTTHNIDSKNTTGTYVGSLAEMGELMDLVRSGKIDPVPVEARNVSEADKTIKDLASGSINGLVCLKHDH